MINLNRIIEFVLQHRILAHILYWLFILLFAIVYGLGYSRPAFVSLILQGIYLPVQIGATYVFLYLQFPLLYKKRYAFFVISLLVTAYLFQFLAHLNYDFGLGTRLISWHKPHAFVELFTDAEFLYRFIVDVYLVVFISAGIKMIKSHLISRQTMANFEAEKAKSEYIYLQSQMHPEFLLRSLKQIQRKSAGDAADTPEAISNLSEVLDYSLYRSDAPMVTMEEEFEKLCLYAKMYADASQSIGDVNCTESGNNHAITIKPMTLLNATEALFGELEQGPGNHGINISMTSSARSCDLAYEIGGMPWIPDQEKIQRIVEAIASQFEIAYKERIEIYTMGSPNLLDITVKIKI